MLQHFVKYFYEKQFIFSIKFIQTIFCCTNDGGGGYLIYYDSRYVWKKNFMVFGFEQSKVQWWKEKQKKIILTRIFF